MRFLYSPTVALIGVWVAFNPAFAQNLAPAPTPCQINGVTQTVSAVGDRNADTTNIQNAMNACTTVGAQLGKPLYVALQPGNYIIKPITMRSYVFLLLPAGAVLNASTVTADYQIAGSGTCGGIASSSSGCKPLISSGNSGDAVANNTGIIGSRAVGIMGGTIEGHGWDITSNGSSWWAIADTANAQGKKQICPRLIEFDNGVNVLIRDVTLQNSPYFHLVFSQCTNVTELNLKIQSPTPDHPSTARNTDGTDVISSAFVSITNSHIISGDDNIAITAANKGASHDITIQNCHFGKGHGLSIGSGTNGGVSNVHAKQIYFNGTDNGIRFKSDSSEGGDVSNIYYDTLCMKAINTFSLSSKNGAIDLDTQYSSTTGTLYPYFHNVYFHDIYSDVASATITGTVWDNVRLNGAGGNRPMANLFFYNVNFSLPKTAAPVSNTDLTTTLVYSNSLNLTIPGLATTPAPAIDPAFNEAANSNLAGYCQTYNN